MRHAENDLLLFAVRRPHRLLTGYFLSAVFSSFTPLLAIKYASMN